jgi:hypothetical protein
MSAPSLARSLIASVLGSIVCAGCQSGTSILLSIEAPGVQLASLGANVALQGTSIARALTIPAGGGAPALPATISLILPNVDTIATITITGRAVDGTTYSEVMAPIAVFAHHRSAPPPVVLGQSTVDGGADLAAQLLYDDEFDADDLATSWTIDGGMWSIGGGILSQTDVDGDDLVAADATMGFTDVHAVARLKQVSVAQDLGTTVDAAELAVRASISPLAMYRCVWDAASGTFGLQVQIGSSPGTDLDRILVQGGGYDPQGWFTMHFVAKGTSLTCWLDEVPGKMLSATDSQLSSGNVALKTYHDAVDFDYVRVYTP